MDHPEVGLLLFEHTTFQLHDDPDLKIVVFVPLPGSDSPEKLRYLSNSGRTRKPLAVSC